jgi:hypothetical protein
MDSSTNSLPPEENYLEAENHASDYFSNCKTLANDIEIWVRAFIQLRMEGTVEGDSMRAQGMMQALNVILNKIKDLKSERSIFHLTRNRIGKISEDAKSLDQMDANDKGVIFFKKEIKSTLNFEEQIALEKIPELEKSIKKLIQSADTIIKETYSNIKRKKKPNNIKTKILDKFKIAIFDFKSIISDMDNQQDLHYKKIKDLHKHLLNFISQFSF